MKTPSSPLNPPSGEQPSPVTPPRRKVLWLQVSGLAALQGATTLTWAIYSLYIPQLLAQLGFPATLATRLLVIETLLAAGMEPLMGSLSDQAYRWVGTRFPFISGGIILSSALFILIPATVIFGHLASGTEWMLPMAIVAWALAMTVFRSPAISLLGRYASPKALPLAASLLTLSGGLIGALQPFVNRIILWLGPAFTFAIGSFVLLGAGAALRFVHPPDSPPPPQQNSASAAQPDISALVPALSLIFVTAFSVASGARFLMGMIPKLVKNQFSAGHVDWVMFAITVAVGFAALPAGAIAVKLGNHRAMLYGLGATIGFMLLMAMLPNLVIVVIAVLGLVAAFSLIVNGTIPYALSLVPPQHAALGVGMYFGGSAAAAGLFGIVFTPFDRITPIISAILGAIAFLVTSLCIFASTKIKVQNARRTSSVSEND